jgi:hypothetical protein
LSRDRAAWTDPIDYGPCQVFADAARSAIAEVIRYESTRDPQLRANLAVLVSAVFAKPSPLDRQSWPEFGRERRDPRVAGMAWDR